MLPIWTIILFLLFSSKFVNIEAFPEDILSEYFSSAFSVFITFDFAKTEFPILASNEVNIILSIFF